MESKHKRFALALDLTEKIWNTSQYPNTEPKQFTCIQRCQDEIVIEEERNSPSKRPETYAANAKKQRLKKSKRKRKMAIIN
eukprot:scaffold95379_cov17-Prasinocladus_malaysianus.AAC.1